MSDTRRARGESSKRKTRDGPEELVARKKQHRQPAHDSDNVELEGQSSDGDGRPAISKGPKAPAARNEKEYPSVNELKKRIRDVKRLLAKGTLPADARVVQERALAGYEQDVIEETARRQRSQMIKKYHFVRFLGMLN